MKLLLMYGMDTWPAESCQLQTDDDVTIKRQSMQPVQGVIKFQFH